MPTRTHEYIDARSLALARAVVAKIDADPDRTGLSRARSVCERWFQRRKEPAHKEWLDLLEHRWANVRAALLEDSETGRRRRQSSPFCGILTPRERWHIYRTYRQRETH